MLDCQNSYEKRTLEKMRFVGQQYFRRRCFCNCRSFENKYDAPSFGYRVSIVVHDILPYLVFSLNQMNDKGTKRILEAVAGHPNLKELKLNANQAHAETAEALCFLLRNNTILKNIDLSSNSFSGHEESIEAALNQNQNITLHLLSCDLREEFLLCIQQFLAFREEL